MEEPNISYIQNLSGGDIDFEKKLIDIIKTEFPIEKENYINCLSLNKFLEASEIVHKIKHKISILGLEKGYEVATTFENNLRNDNTSLSAEFESVLDTMSNYINQL